MTRRSRKFSALVVTSIAAGIGAAGLILPSSTSRRANPTPAIHTAQVGTPPIPGAPPLTPSAGPVHKTTSTPLTGPAVDKVNSASQSLKDQAAQVHSQADFDAASPEVQQFLKTATAQVSQLDVTPIASPPKVVSRRSGGGKYQLIDQWYATWPPGACFNLSMRKGQQNVFGTWLAWLDFGVNNYCWGPLYGGWAIYAPMPSHWYSAGAQYGWSTCGVRADWSGIQQSYYGVVIEWGAATSYAFFPWITCYTIPLVNQQVFVAAIYVYNQGSVDYV